MYCSNNVIFQNIYHINGPFRSQIAFSAENGPFRYQVIPIQNKWHEIHVHVPQCLRCFMQTPLLLWYSIDIHKCLRCFINRALCLRPGHRHLYDNFKTKDVENNILRKYCKRAARFYNHGNACAAYAVFAIHLRFNNHSAVLPAFLIWWCRRQFGG